MTSTSKFKFNRFSRIAAVAVVLGLGAGGPASALDMICGNVSGMESTIANTPCCTATTADDPQYLLFGFIPFNLCTTTWAPGYIGKSQCALASGPLQACCSDPSDTAGEQTACLCGEVSGYTSTQLGFTPAGC